MVEEKSVLQSSALVVSRRISSVVVECIFVYETVIIGPKSFLHIVRLLCLSLEPCYLCDRTFPCQ